MKFQVSFKKNLLIYVNVDVKQEEMKELVAVFYNFFHKKYQQNLK